MTRSTFGGVLVALVLASGVAALAQQQSFDPSQADPQTWFQKQCPACGVRGYVDYPGKAATIKRSNMVVAGWGFECVSGVPVDRIDVWYEANDGLTLVPLKQADGALHFGSTQRPDVAFAYGPYCPMVPLTTGWWLQVTNPPPAGARRVFFVLWNGPYHSQIARTYNLVD